MIEEVLGFEEYEAYEAYEEDFNAPWAEEEFDKDYDFFID